VEVFFPAHIIDAEALTVGAATFFVLSRRLLSLQALVAASLRRALQSAMDPTACIQKDTGSLICSCLRAERVGKKLLFVLATFFLGLWRSIADFELLGSATLKEHWRGRECGAVLSRS
jgi:hypothetical protein